MDEYIYRELVRVAGLHEITYYSDIASIHLIATIASSRLARELASQIQIESI